MWGDKLISVLFPFSNGSIDILNVSNLYTVTTLSLNSAWWMILELEFAKAEASGVWPIKHGSMIFKHIALNLEN